MRKKGGKTSTIKKNNNQKKKSKHICISIIYIRRIPNNNNAEGV